MGLLLFITCIAANTVSAQSPDLGKLVFEPASPGDTMILTPQQQEDDQIPGALDNEAETAILDSIDLYQAGINSSIESGDSYSGLIREQYFSLGRAQQQLGEHEQAIQSFEQAMQIDRVNEGLFTLSQQDLVEAIIESHDSLGNFREVADYREYLYLVQMRSFADDDPALLAAKEDWADWNVRSYYADKARNAQGMTFTTSAGVDNDTDYVAIYNPRLGSTLYVPRNQIPNVMNPISGPGAGDLYQRSLPFAVSPETIVDERLKRAETLYEEILDPEREGIRSEREAAIREKLGSIAYAKKRQMDAIEDNSDSAFTSSLGLRQRRTTNPMITRGYTEIRDHLETVIAELETAPDTPPAALATALVKLGDWHLGYDRNQRGFDAYARAWSVLSGAGFTTAQMQEFFNPTPVVPIPSFTIVPYSRASAGLPQDAELDYKGYIDLTLNIDRYGNVRRRRVEDTSTDTPQPVRRKLMDFLEDQKMRPLIVDGATQSQESLVVRYYYSY
jgi:tetratricopeptide (TPR) repeat protein